MDYKEKQVVWISADVHKELKEYCKNHGLKMVYVVEKLIKKKLNITWAGMAVKEVNADQKTKRK